MTNEDRTRIRGLGPLAQALAKKLRRHIVGTCEPGDRLPAEVALTKQHHCSSTTVRAALALLAEEGLIIRRHGSGTYVTEGIPRGQRSTDFIYFGSPRMLLLTPWARDVYLGLLSVAEEAGRSVNLRIASPRSPAAVQLEELGGVDRQRVDSVISLEVFNGAVLTEFARHVPVVCIDFPCFQPGVSSGYLDHDQNVAVAVEHLWRLGHRRIAVAGNVRERRLDPAVSARLLAFRKAMAGRGLIFSSRHILPFVTAPEAVELVRALLAAPPAERPTAVICVNYHWMLAQAAVSLGLRIPADMSLVAIGDEGPWTENITIRDRKDHRWDVQQVLTGKPTDMMDPALSVLRNLRVCQASLPFEQMGKWAMREVLRRLEDGEAEPEHEAFTCVLEPGNSAAPPPAT